MQLIIHKASFIDHNSIKCEDVAMHLQDAYLSHSSWNHLLFSALRWRAKTMTQWCVVCVCICWIGELWQWYLSIADTFGTVWDKLKYPD